MDDFRYTYAVARVNALSVELLDKEFASRMLAAEPEEILGMLGETSMAESFAGVDSPFEIEKGLGKELRETYDLLEKICPDKEAIRLFRHRHDFHNLKAMLKSRIKGIPHQKSMTNLGVYDTSALADAVRENNYRFTPAHLREAALGALAEYEKTQRLETITHICDQLMWRHILHKAKKTRNKIMIELFGEHVNLANLKSFFRFKELSTDPEVFKRHFIPGGTYSLDFFIHHMDEELGLFLDHLAKTRYEQLVITRGLHTWPEHKTFWRLELTSDNVLLNQFRQMRHQIFSIAPLIYYLLRKIADTRLIRTVIQCKLIGMERSDIEDRLRCIYV
jgi:V/A-type H+-transporting ATPase subunit C